MVIVLKENSEEIRDKIKSAGINVCICAQFVDACWLDYHPNVGSVHGIGFHSDEPYEPHTQQEAIDRFLAEATDIVLCKDVEEFITKINFEE